MKIAFLSRYQNTVSRGAESFVTELSSRLLKNQKVEVLVGDKSDSFNSLINGKYDVVISLNGRMQALKASLGRLIGGYKILISGHSGIGRDDFWNLMIVRPDVFVALTDKELNWAKKWGRGIRVIKIPNGVDLNKFNPKGPKIDFNLPKPIILSVGSLVWYKYHERAIEAVSRLDEGSLLIVGTGDLESKLKELGDHKLPGRFKIARFGYEAMPAVYRAADIFTLPSWDREAFGLVYLEAMASNLPVVAPNDLSRKEIIGGAGILVDVANIDDYAKAINQALNSNWGDKPRKQAEKFSWDFVSRKYEDLLIEIKK